MLPSQNILHYIRDMGIISYMLDMSLLIMHYHWRSIHFNVSDILPIDLLAVKYLTEMVLLFFV